MEMVLFCTVALFVESLATNCRPTIILFWSRASCSEQSKWHLKPPSHRTNMLVRQDITENSAIFFPQHSCRSYLGGFTVFTTQLHFHFLFQTENWQELTVFFWRPFWDFLGWRFGIWNRKIEHLTGPGSPTSQRFPHHETCDFFLFLLSSSLTILFSYHPLPSVRIFQSSVVIFLALFFLQVLNPIFLAL